MWFIPLRWIKYFDPLPPTFYFMHLPTSGRRFFSILLAVIILTACFIGPKVQAATVQRQSQVSLNYEKSNLLNVLGGKFKGGTSLAAGDINGDGNDELIVGAGPGGGPQIEVYSASGKRLLSFFTLDKKVTSGIYVGAGDLNNDGLAEIIVGPQSGQPTVEVYSATGQRIIKFKAFEKSYTGGVRVAIVPGRNNQVGQLVTASGSAREVEIRVYDAGGRTVNITWLPLKKFSGEGVSIAAGWSDTYQQDVIIAGRGSGQRPLVQVYGLTSKKLLTQWRPYDVKMTSGVWVAFQNDTVVTGVGPGSRPNVRSFTITGQRVSSGYAFESKFTGGTAVAAVKVNGLVKVAASPMKQSPKSAAASGKKIVVDISDQKLTLYENGHPISVRAVSTGKRSMPTPLGTFYTRNKIQTAYSRAYGLYMEYWMAFSPDGRYGIHSLPYWRLKNGGRLYEGANHLGTPVSHGCIRQSLANAKSLFDWAPIGTPVHIVP